jgi:hypothetical protein
VEAVVWLAGAEPMEDALGGLLFKANGLAHQFEKCRIEAEGNP